VAVLESGAYPVKETVTRTVRSMGWEAMQDWSANPAQVTKIHVEV